MFMVLIKIYLESSKYFVYSKTIIKSKNGLNDFDFTILKVFEKTVKYSSSIDHTELMISNRSGLVATNRADPDAVIAHCNVLVARAIVISLTLSHLIVTAFKRNPNYYFRVDKENLIIGQTNPSVAL